MMVGKRVRRRLCLLSGDRGSAYVMVAAKLGSLVPRGLKRRYLIAHLASPLSGLGKAARMGSSGSAQNLDESLTKSLVRTVKHPNRLRVMFKPTRLLTEASQRLATPSEGSWTPTKKDALRIDQDRVDRSKKRETNQSKSR